MVVGELLLRPDSISEGNNSLAQTSKRATGKLAGRSFSAVTRKGKEGDGASCILGIWGAISFAILIAGVILVFKGMKEVDGVIVKNMKMIIPGSILVAIGGISLLPVLAFGRAD